MFFVLAKAVGTGVILGVALVHLLDPAQKQLNQSPIILLSPSASSSAAFSIALISILCMHTIETAVSSLYQQTEERLMSLEDSASSPLLRSQITSPSHGHSHGHGGTFYSPTTEIGDAVEFVGGASRLRARVAAIMMGFGTSLHSLFIGFTLGACEEDQLVTLTVALCLHQFFEGLALGTKLVESPIQLQMECGMAVLFTLSAPIAALMAVGLIALVPNGRNWTSFSITQGVTDASCAGILLYLGFGLLHNDFFADMQLIMHESGKYWLQWAMVVALWGGAAIMMCIGVFV